MGPTLRSPHPHARIGASTPPARWPCPGVYAVLTYDDVPGEMQLRPGDPGPAGARRRRGPLPRRAGRASSPPTTRRPPAARPAKVGRLRASSSRSPTPEAALDGTGAHAPRRAANVLRHRARSATATLRRRARARRRRRRASTSSACRTRPSSARSPARRARRGRRRRPLRRHPVAARRPRQIAPVLGLPEDKVRMTLAGVGGAFGGREDLSMQIHACLLALRTGKPVKMVYNRFESFFGHVHRHPAKLHYEHGATKDGKLTHMKAASCSTAAPTPPPPRRSSATPPLSARARTSSERRHRGDRRSTPTTRPAARCAASARSRPASPTRRRWTSSPRSSAWTRSSSAAATPWSRARSCRPARWSTPRPRSPSCCAASRRCRCRRRSGAAGDGGGPARAARRRLQHHPRRGRRPRRRLRGRHQERRLLRGLRRLLDRPRTDGGRRRRAVADRAHGAAEVGQGGVTVHAQIARTELGVDHVTVLPGRHPGRARRLDLRVPPDVRHRRRGKPPARPSASRLLEHGRRSGLGAGPPSCSCTGGKVVTAAASRARARRRPRRRRDRGRRASAGTARPCRSTRRPARATATSQYAFAAHRAVVEVDTELGLVKVIELASAQDVGKALNPLSVVGQIQGGTPRASASR